MNAKRLKYLKMAAVTFMLLGLAGQLWTLAAWNYDASALPRSPDAQSGRVYKLNFHGITVYQTTREHTIYWGTDDASNILFIVGFAFGILHEWKSEGLMKFLGT
ncbi:MAG TPA: hypothetical protein VNI36_12680 [Candidatus Dormibacteraeota bacterium]|nr:hypothetical protein [Candidatus Dormibacteraeota bacterium]